MRDFAQIWQAADKVVYSRTLRTPSTARTRIEPEFDPEAVRRMKESVERDIGTGGSDLAGQLARAGLVDEYHLFLAPSIVGGGKPSLPRDVRIDLELTGQRRFDGGMVYLNYRPRT
jgi:dihydrofolate reductase